MRYLEGKGGAVRTRDMAAQAGYLSWRYANPLLDATRAAFRRICAAARALQSTR